MFDSFIPGRKASMEQQKALTLLAQQKSSAIIAREERRAAYKKGLARKIRKSNSLVHTAFGPPSMRHVNRDGAKSYGTLSNYVTTPLTAHSAYSQIETIADRAWDLYTNDPAAYGIIETICSDVVETGLTPIATPMTEYLGFDAEWEDEYQQSCRDDWEIWGMSPSKYCDATRRMNINEMTTWTVFSWKIEGIALWIPLMLPESPLREFSLSLQPIAAYRLKTPVDLFMRTDIYNGVEVNANGAPIAYWIKNNDGNDSSLKTDSKSNFVRIPAYNDTTGRPNIIACYSTRNISDYRSESIITSVLKTLRDRHDHMDAALVGAIVANMVTMYIKNGLRETDVEGNPIREPFQEIANGTIIYGAPGEEPEVIKTDRPGPHFKDMNSSTIEELGMGSLRGTEKVSRKWDSSFSASRMSSEQARKIDNVDRMTVIYGFLNRARGLLLEESMLRGRIPVKSPSHFYENYYAYTKARWLPPARIEVDQVKAETADQLALQNGSKNLDDICAENGEHWKDKLKQRAKEQKYIKNLESEYGVTLSMAAPATAKPSDNQDKDKDDE